MLVYVSHLEFVSCSAIQLTLQREDVLVVGGTALG